MHWVYIHSSGLLVPTVFAVDFVLTALVDTAAN